MRCSPNRAYHLPSSCLINLSYGKRLEANRGGVDLPDSAQRGGASNRGSPATSLLSRGGHGGKEDRGRFGSPHVSSASPSYTPRTPESSERPLRAAASKGLSSGSAGKVVRARKSDDTESSQPRTLLQRQDKRQVVMPSIPSPLSSLPLSLFPFLSLPSPLPSPSPSSLPLSLFPPSPFFPLLSLPSLPLFPFPLFPLSFFTLTLLLIPSLLTLMQAR